MQDKPLKFLKIILNYIFASCLKSWKMKILIFDSGLWPCRPQAPGELQLGKEHKEKVLNGSLLPLKGFNNETHRGMYAWSKEFTDCVIYFLRPNVTKLRDGFQTVPITEWKCKHSLLLTEEVKLCLPCLLKLQRLAIL